MSKQVQGNFMLLLTAMIWGSAFVAQSVGMDYIQPFTFNMTRNFIAFIVLIPIVFFFLKNNPGIDPIPAAEKKMRQKNTIIGGICCGIVLGIADAFQQTGISMTTAGKAGFITALYIIMVPILGKLLKKHTPRSIWFCTVIALLGFYLLCVKEDFTVEFGDILVFICAICFSFHILVIDYFAQKNTNGVMMSCIQFFAAAVFSSILTACFEQPTLSGIWAARIPLLYAAVLSSGVGYTLQILAQRHTNPTIATLIMSLESVFAALFGSLILGEVLSPKELAGCILVFIAVILAQIPLPSFFQRR